MGPNFGVVGSFGNPLRKPEGNHFQGPPEKDSTSSTKNGRTVAKSGEHQPENLRTGIFQ